MIGVLAPGGGGAGGTRSFPALGFDPAPGELSAVGSVLESLQNAYGQLSECSARMAGALEVSDTWEGDAADDFHDYGDDLPKAFETGAQSIVAAGNALDAWAGKLAANQQEADRLEREAKRLKKELKQAAADMDAAAGALGNSTGGQKYAAYLRTVDRWSGLNDQLRLVIDNARRLEAKHLREANAAAAAIRGGDDDAFKPESDGWFVQLTDGAAKVSGEVAKWAGTAAAIAAVVPGGQPFAAGLGTVAAGAAAVNTVAGGLQIAAGSRNKPSLVELGLGVVPARTVTSAARQGLKGGLQAGAKKGFDTNPFITTKNNIAALRRHRHASSVKETLQRKASRDELSRGTELAGDSANDLTRNQLRELARDQAGREAAAAVARVPFDAVDTYNNISDRDIKLPGEVKAFRDGMSYVLDPSGDRIEKIIGDNAKMRGAEIGPGRENYAFGDTGEALDRRRGRWGG